MSELPKGWVSISIDEITSDVSYGVTATSDPEVGDLKLLRITDIQDNKVNWATVPYCKYDIKFENARLCDDDIVVARTGATVGKSFLIKKAVENSVFASYLIRLRCNSAIQPKYLSRFLNTPSYWRQISEQKAGIGQPNVNGTKLKTLNVPLAPQAEQTRIVEKLDEVLAQVDAIKTRLDSIPAILKRFRQSVLAAAVSGRLTEEWRGDCNYTDILGLSLPAIWQVKQAKEICDKVQSGSTPRDNPFDQNGIIPFLKVYNIVNQTINFDYKPQFVTADIHNNKLGRSIAYPYDILMNIVGPPLGKVAILTDQYKEWNINQAITLFRANSELLNYRYLYYVLCEGSLVRAVMPETKGSVGQINISLSQCRDANIPLPSLDEQKEIVRLVDQYFAFADTIEAQVKKAQTRVDNLTQSILAKAFRGELVAQDPSDEPAEKLLERIAQARKEAEALAKAAKKVAKTK